MTGFEARTYTTADVLKMALAILRDPRGDDRERLYWVSNVLFHVRADEFEDLQRAEVWRELKVIVHVTGIHVPFPALDTHEARFATKCAACIESFCLTYLAGRPVETASRLFDD